MENNCMKKTFVMLKSVFLPRWIIGDICPFEWKGCRIVALKSLSKNKALGEALYDEGGTIEGKAISKANAISKAIAIGGDYANTE
jgi:nucleoside diphosphate kinase